MATLGTALTENHLQKLFRYTSELVFCFDGDKAGPRSSAAHWKSRCQKCATASPPNSYFCPMAKTRTAWCAKWAPADFQKLVDEPKPLSEFLFEQLSDGIDCSTADGKARLSKVCAPQINRIPQGVFRQLMLEELSAAPASVPTICVTMLPVTTPLSREPQQNRQRPPASGAGQMGAPDYGNRDPGNTNRQKAFIPAWNMNAFPRSKRRAAE